MSVYFTIKEHLNISQNSSESLTACEAKGIMRGSIAALGALVLLNEADHIDLHLIADGKEYKVTDDSFVTNIKTLLSALENAEILDMTAEYEYCSHTGWALYDVVGPFSLMAYMDQVDPSDMEGVFYSAWNSADCADGPGILVAYGEANGQSYHGDVSFSEVEKIPSGLWYNSDTVIYVEPESFDVESNQEVIEACNAFRGMGGDTQLETNDGLYFCLNNITLDTSSNPELGTNFIDAVKRLQRLVPEDFSIMANFFDVSGKDVKLMKIEETDDGFCVKVAKV